MKRVQSVETIDEYADNITQGDIQKLTRREMYVECVNPECSNFIKYQGMEAEEKDIYKRGQLVPQDCKGIRITRNRDGELKIDHFTGIYQAYCSNECGVAHQL